MSRPLLDPRTLLARWTVGEWVIAVASVAMVVALLLDWTSVSCTDSTICRVQPSPVTAMRGWAWLDFAGVFTVLCLLLVRTILAGTARVPELTVSDSTAYTALGAVELLGCFLFWLENPAVKVGATTIRPGPGWYVALIAAAATVAGGRLLRGRARRPQQLDLFDDADDTAARDLHHTGLGV